MSHARIRQLFAAATMHKIILQCKSGKTKKFGVFCDDYSCVRKRTADGGIMHSPQDRKVYNASGLVRHLACISCGRSALFSDAGMFHHLLGRPGIFLCLPFFRVVSGALAIGFRSLRSFVLVQGSHDHEFHAACLPILAVWPASPLVKSQRELDEEVQMSVMFSRQQNERRAKVREPLGDLHEPPSYWEN